MSHDDFLTLLHRLATLLPDKNCTTIVRMHDGGIVWLKQRPIFKFSINTRSHQAALPASVKWTDDASQTLDRFLRYDFREPLRLMIGDYGALKFRMRQGQVVECYLTRCWKRGPTTRPNPPTRRR